MSDPVTTAILICLIPALALLACIYYINRAAARQAHEVLAKYQTQVSRMGQYIGRPRTTFHSIVNKLFSKPERTHLGAIGMMDEFADVSFYQGVINWAKMRTKARKVIIRAGQNLWPDLKFVDNYPQAKQAGFLRGVYFFYDGRADPGKQAALLVSLIKNDPPELGVWIDWERSFGGAHEGLRNVVAMMQEVERLLPGVEVGMYTGFYWFVENGNPITHRTQYAYLKTKKLWLAFYALLKDVRIPSLWPHMTYWQKGTPAVGKAWGCDSEELDMNENMSAAPDPAPEPEPENGETMQYKIVWQDGANERIGPGTNFALTGVIYPVNAIVNVINNPDLTATNVWGQLDNSKWVALKYNGTTRAVPVVAPSPAPTPDAVRLVIESIETRFIVRDDATGKRYGATVTDSPNVTFVEL